MQFVSMQIFVLPIGMFSIHNRQKVCPQFANVLGDFRIFEHTVQVSNIPSSFNTVLFRTPISVSIYINKISNLHSSFFVEHKYVMIKTERKNVILIHGLPADTAVFLTSLDFKNGATNLITTKYYSAETIPIVYTPQFDQYACVDALISLISCPAAAEAAELVELRSKTEANVLIAVAIVHPFEKAWTCAELHDKRIHYLDCGTEFVYWDLNAELHINRRIELHDFGVDDVEEETAVERVGAALAANVWDGMRMKSEVRPRNTNANAIPIVKDVAIENESNSSSNEGNFQSTCESSLGDIETLNDEEIEVVQPEIDFKGNSNVT